MYSVRQKLTSQRGEGRLRSVKRSGSCGFEKPAHDPASLAISRENIIGLVTQCLGSGDSE